MDVIKALYPEVFNLEEMLYRYDGSGTLRTTLTQEDSSQGFKDFVRTTIVGLPEPIVQRSNISMSQNSHQREVVHRVIERLIRRDGAGKNILTLGFYQMSDDVNAQISSGVNIEYGYPNNNVNRLHYKVWKELLSKIGDALMMLLLEKASIFVLLAPTCYIQIAGTPIYNAWPYEIGKTIAINKSGEKRFDHKTEKPASDNKTKTNKKCISDFGERQEPDSLGQEPACKRQKPDCQRQKPACLRQEPALPRQEPVCLRQEPACPRQEQVCLRQKPVYLRQKPPCPRHEPVLRQEPASTRQEPVCPSQKPACQNQKPVCQRQRLACPRQKPDQRSHRGKKRKACMHNTSLDEAVESQNEYKKQRLNDVIDESNDIENVESKNCNDGMKMVHSSVVDVKSSKEQRDDLTCVDKNREPIIVDHGVDCVNSLKRKREHVLFEQTIGEVPEAKRFKKDGKDKTFDNLRVNASQPKRSDCFKDALKCFRPYDHLIFLSRILLFYNRNTREKVSKSATISCLDCNCAEAARFLYQKILRDTSVHADAPPVEIATPDLATFTSPSVADDSNVPVSVEIATPDTATVVSNATIIDSSHPERGKIVNHNISEEDPREGELANSEVSYHSEKSDWSGNSLIDFGYIDSNQTIVKAHPSFADSRRHGSLTTPHCRLGERTQTDNSCPRAHLGARKLEMLSLRKQSILKGRSHLNGSESYCDETSVPVCDKVVDKKERLEMISGRNNTTETELFESKFIAHSLKLSGNNNLESSRSTCINCITEEPVDVSHGIAGENLVVCELDTSEHAFCKNSMNENLDRSFQFNKLTIAVAEANADNRHENVKVRTEMANLTLTRDNETHTETVGEMKTTNNANINEGSEKLHLHGEKEILRPYCLDEAQKIKDPQENEVVYSQSTKGFESTSKDDVKKLQVPVIPELLEMLEEFAKRHRSCPYKVLLQHHCPLSWRQREGQSCLTRKHVAKETVARLLGDHIHPRKVYLFLRVCFLKTVPPQLLGSPHNRNVILKNISRIVSLGKFEKVCLGQLMAGLKTSEIPWLQHVHQNNLKLHLLAKLVYWIFNEYIFVLLKTYFYITETTFVKYRLLYYRQLVWNKLFIQGFSGLLQKKILRPLPESVAEDMLKKGRSLGMCVLRFLPKQGSLRPIMNMSRTSTHFTSKKLSINHQLTDLLHILTYMKNKKPSLTGVGKFGMDDVYTSWERYHTHWDQLGRPELYFVKTDIVNCYDTILQKKLYSILEDVFSQIEDDFIVRKYATVMVARGNLKRTFHRAVSPLSEYEPDFVRVAKEMVTKNSMHDVILVDKVLHQHESKESLLQLLSSHLFSNIVKVGSKYYHQTCGISQGSVLSTLLCSLYYANMERKFFTISDDDLLMRIVDDYLYVTPSQERATKFLSRMLNGISEYSCFVNSDKVLTNFEHSSEKFGQVAFVKETFPWCGMLFNTETLEVQVDYSRYAGHRISDSITFDLCHKPGIAMKKKIVLSSRPKCHSMFMDRKINSEHQISVNCYQLFLLSAYKFSSYVVRLPVKQRADRNPKFFYSIICDLSKYVYNQTNKELKSKKGQDREPEVVSLSQDSLEWLCLKAFKSVLLQRHHSLFKAVIRLLRQGLRILENTKISVKRLPLCADDMSKLDRQFAEIMN